MIVATALSPDVRALLSLSVVAMDRISRKYIGKEFPMRANPEQRVVLVIEVQRARYTVLPFSHTPPQRPLTP